MSEQSVRIFDTTLRDGEQAPGFSLRTSEKLQLARQLDELGVDIIEADPDCATADGSRSPHRQKLSRSSRAWPGAIARIWKGGMVDCPPCCEGPHSYLHRDVRSSPAGEAPMSREQCLETAVDAVRFARQHTDDVQFSAEDATRSDMEFLCRVVQAVIDAGATTINSPTPSASRRRDMREFFTTISIKRKADAQMRSRSARTATG